MQTINYIHSNFPDIELEVSYEYYYDPGKWTYSNGDPGYPEYEEINIKHIKILNSDSNLYDLLEYGNMIIENIEYYISELEREKR